MLYLVLCYVPEFSMICLLYKAGIALPDMPLSAITLSN